MTTYTKVTRSKLLEQTLLDDVSKRHRQYQTFERGYWVVKGADTGDMTTTNIPILGYYCGKFVDVAHKAVEFERWTGWDSEVGGTIEKIDVIDLRMTEE